MEHFSQLQQEGQITGIEPFFLEPHGSELGGKTCCLLDLSADRIVPCTRVHLLGLQALADQFGLALQNARFYRQLNNETIETVPDITQFPEENPTIGGLAMFPGSPVIQSGASPRKTSPPTKMAGAYVQENYGEPITRTNLATSLGVCENYLTDLFHREMGISLWTYLNRYRVKQAKVLIDGTELKITEIATRAGFDDPAYFSWVFCRRTGRSPRAYRKSPSYAEVVAE